MEKLLLLIRLCQIDYIYNKIDYKKNLLVLFLLLLAEFAYSQTNFSFVDDDMEWSYITFRSSEFEGPSYRKTTIKKYFGDTIINGFQYTKMFESNDNGETWNESGYYRESEKKVYAIKKGESIEKVCYDFNIKPGLYEEEFYVYVDTLSILGVQVPMYNFYDEYERDERNYYGSIIDEIGYVNWGNGLQGAPYTTDLLCVQKGNELLWQNPNCENCYYKPYSVIELDTHNSILLKESEIWKYANDNFDDDLQFQLKGNVLYISGILELSCFSRGNWLLYTIDGNTITLEDDAEDGWIISKNRLFTLNFLKIDGCTADYYDITFRGKTYSVKSTTSFSALNQQITISPNPVQDILYLTLSTANNLIQIIDAQGRKVLQTECGETASVNVSQLKKGVYTVIVNNKQSQTFVKE